RIVLRELAEGRTVSAQARQLFDGLWEVVRARGLHELAPELWPVMLVSRGREPSRRPPGDIQAALRVLGRRNPARDVGNLDLNRANLCGAILREANLNNVNFRWANLREANLMYATMDRATLQGADLRGASLD